MNNILIICSKKLYRIQSPCFCVYDNICDTFNLFDVDLLLIVNTSNTFVKTYCVCQDQWQKSKNALSFIENSDKTAGKVRDNKIESNLHLIYSFFFRSGFFLPSSFLPLFAHFPFQPELFPYVSVNESASPSHNHIFWFILVVKYGNQNRSLTPS